MSIPANQGAAPVDGIAGHGPALRRAGIVGVAAVPHAPQFLSLPETEDLAQVERVRAAMAALGERLRALGPDCIVVLSNDHGDHFVTHACPPFCVHAASQADGMHRHRGPWAVDGDTGYALVGAMEREGFDLAFTLSARLPTAFTIPYEFMGFDRDTPMTALFVNSYLPPQPSPLRCHAFGAALDRALRGLGRRALLVASGGLSHYPGTRHYPHPDVATDRLLFEHMCEGRLSRLLGYDAAELDGTGNVELRAVLAAAGVVGARKPFASLFEPSWHHTYAVLGWDLTEPEPRAQPPIYPALPSRRAALAEAVYRLRAEPASAARYLADPAAYCAEFALAEDERAALMDMDAERLRDEFGIHALLTSGAATQLRLVREKTPASKT